MAKRKSAEGIIEPRQSKPDAEPDTRPEIVSIPKKWVGMLAVLLIVPWLIAGAIYLAGNLPSASTASKETAAATSRGTLGTVQAWGVLETSPITISPPLELIPSNWGPIEPPQWRFPQTSREDLERFFVAAGLGSDAVRLLMAASLPEPRINGFVVKPDPGFVKSLTRETRAKIYLQLAITPLNDRHYNSYRHYTATTEGWLGKSLISPQTMKAVDPYIYRAGDFLYFSDIDLVRTEVQDPAELQRLAKALFRESTLMVRVHLTDPAKAGQIAEYWGRGGRRTDILPLLESLAMTGPDASIDIAHLLPELPRRLLYRYPQMSLADFEKPSFRNCFWTALNFFNAEPDDRLLDPGAAFTKLKSDYKIIHDNFQFGDIVAFSDSAGNYFHASVYLADNLVFGKNGTSPLSPWTIVPIDRLKGYYIDHADDWNIIYFRRKDL